MGKEIVEGVCKHYNHNDGGCGLRSLVLKGDKKSENTASFPSHLVLSLPVSGIMRGLCRDRGPMSKKVVLDQSNCDRYEKGSCKYRESDLRVDIF